MKDSFSVESLKPFIDMDGLKGDELVERKRFSSKISISPDEERTCVSLISTIDVDADDEVVIPTGADLKRFTKNPVIHVNHSYKVEDVVGKAVALSVQEDGILAKIKFADTPRALDCWQLIKGGFVNSNSIGFIAKERFHRGTEEFDKFVKENKLKIKDTVQRIISKFELLESSIVSLPCNPEALVVAISEKSINLSDKTIKELDLPKVIVIKEEPKVTTTITTQVGEISETKVIEEPKVEEVKEESYGELFEMKPFPNEHAARQEDPSKYVRFRRKNDAGGSGIHFIYGITSDGKVELQSIRADASKFTVAQFKKWLEDHHMKTNIEAATGERSIKILRYGGVDIKKLAELRKLAIKGKIV